MIQRHKGSVLTLNFERHQNSQELKMHYKKFQRVMVIVVCAREERKKAKYLVVKYLREALAKKGSHARSPVSLK
jgi:hypothetical protein